MMFSSLFPSLSRLVQKRLDGPHHFGIPVAADVMTSPSNMHHLPLFPERCRLLGCIGGNNCAQVRLACHEQNGTLDACHNLTPPEGIHSGKCGSKNAIFSSALESAQGMISSSTQVGLSACPLAMRSSRGSALSSKSHCHPDGADCSSLVPTKPLLISV